MHRLGCIITHPPTHTHIFLPMHFTHRLGHVHDDGPERLEAQGVERLGVRLLPHGRIHDEALPREGGGGVVPDAR